MDVVIVGAGPAGASLSYMLAKHGLQVTLLERETDLSRVFRGEGLMPSGIDALMELGLYDILDGMPTRKLASWDLFINGNDIMRVEERLEELGDRAMRIVPHGQFLEAIIGRAEEYSNFTIHRNVNARDLVFANDRVTGVKALIDNEENVISADLVVACDGRGSILRTRAGLKLKTLPTQYDVQWFKMPAPEQMTDACRFMMFASNDTISAAYTSWDGLLQYALMQMKSDSADYSNEEWAERITKNTPQWLTDHIRSVSDDFIGPVRLNVIAGCAETWWRPGMLMLGDAAHPMAPIRAQGINVALRDVVIAANRLVPVCRQGRDLDSALASIQAERTPEIKRSQHLQYQDTRGIGTWYAPLLIGLAGILGPRMGKYKWAQYAWLNQQRDLRFGSCEVKLDDELALSAM